MSASPKALSETLARRCGLLVSVFVIALPLATFGHSLSKAKLLNLKFEQKLDAQIPLELSFIDDGGEPVKLRDFFGARPVVLMLGYYQCPMLCNLELNGAVECFQDLRPSVGRDFEVLFVSINPRETSALAGEKKRTYLKRYGRSDAAKGWHFLVGDEREIKALSNATGFQYAYDAGLNQFAHPSGMIVLSPDGRIVKYFFGVSYSAREVSEALKAAAAGHAGSRAREILILCFQHMPLIGENSESIMIVVRGFALAVIFVLAGYVGLSFRREKRALPSEQTTMNAPP